MTATNFEPSLALVLKHEGGYVNHPADPGGATNKGVIQRVYNAYRLSKKLPVQSVKHLSEAELRDIYKRQYWDAIKGDALPSGVDYCTFDAAVNSGPVQAAKWLQRALKVTADGNIGVVTLTVAGKASREAVIRSMCSQRMSFLQRLKHWAVFRRGWTSRVNGVLKASLSFK